MTSSFLFELGCEELPAGELKAMAEHLDASITKGLESVKLGFSNTRLYYTPRRLALMIEGLELEIPAKLIRRQGPAKSVGFDAAGQPTQALLGFLKSAQATRADLIEIVTEKGVWLAVDIRQAALPAKIVLPQILQEAIKTLPLKKSMRWGDHDFAFLRPVKWIVALLDDTIVPIELFGLQAGQISYGHRFHHPAPVSLSHASEYQHALRQAFVMVSPAERRQAIVDQSHKVVPEGTEIQYGTLDEVINLVEWPVPLLCQFDPAFLEVPEKVLIATMEANQRVFPLRNKAGVLQPYFITVANLESLDPKAVIKGNEKVVAARLADARFFYQEDLKIPLEAHLEALDKITFQQGLGSLFDKTKRLEQLSSTPRAALLCKTDLVTQMVQEFPELQGYMGYQYARLQGEDPAIAEAIEDHYKPRGKGGSLPRNPVGINLALMDKIDTLVGLFAIGKEPTSNGDPYALRRQALGVIAILVEKQMSVDLTTILQRAYRLYLAQHLKLEDEMMVLQKLTHFFEERLEIWCRDEKSLPITSVKAILKRQSQKGFSPYAEFERIQALSQLLATKEGQDLKELAKRVSNILDVKHPQQLPDIALFQNAERQLWQVVLQAQEECWLELTDIRQCYLQFLQFKQPLSEFFEQIRVNDPDPLLRHNRQSILQSIYELLGCLADFSVL